MVSESSGEAGSRTSAHTSQSAAETPHTAPRPQREITTLSVGSKLTLAVVVSLLLWALVASYWPVTVSGATGETLICGNATTSTPRTIPSCQKVTSRQRLLAAGLVGSAVILGVAGFSTFGVNRRIQTNDRD